MFNELILRSAIVIILLCCIAGCGKGDSEQTDDGNSVIPPVVSPPVVSPPPKANAAPYVTEVKISGDIYVGGYVTLGYLYQDNENDLEGQSDIKWYRDGSLMSDVLGLKYQITHHDFGKKITASVTPKAKTGAISGSMSQSNVINVDKYDVDYTVRATCAQFVNATPKMAYKQEITQLNSEGNQEQVILSYDSGFGYSHVDWYFPTHINHAYKYNALLRDKALGKNGYILVKCFYSNFVTGIDDVYKIIIPLEYDFWIADQYEGIAYLSNADNGKKHIYTNSRYYDVNPLSSLYSDIVIRMLNEGYSYSVADSSAKKIIDTSFPDSIYAHYFFDDFKSHEKQVASFWEGSLQFSYYKSLAADASIVTAGSLSTLYELVADQAFLSFGDTHGGCSVKYICARFFQWENKKINLNSSFAKNTDDWSITRAIFNDAQASLTHYIESSNSGSVLLDFKTNHTASSENSFIEIAQRVSLSDVLDIGSLFLLADYSGLNAGCTAFGGCFASGAAGFFVCLDRHDESVNYCLLYADYYDSIILHNAIGNYFKPGSTDVTKLIKLNSSRQSTLLSIKNAFEVNFPSKTPLKNDDQFVVGAFATEFQTPDRQCIHCSSTIKIKKLSVFETK